MAANKSAPKTKATVPTKKTSKKEKPFEIDPNDIVDQIVFDLPRTNKNSDDFVEEGIKAGFSKRQIEFVLAMAKVSNGQFRF